MPRGGKRDGAGRKPGSPNKIAQDVREIAQNYTDEAFQTLHTIMTDTEEPAAARISAAKEMLERAYGKSPQAINLDAKGTLIIEDGFADLDEDADPAPVEA